MQFQHVTYAEPHRARSQAILKEHPEIRQLFGRNPATAWIILGVVLLQTAIAIFLRNSPWWMIVGMAWLVGAFANHTLWVLIHECAHNLLFTKKWANQWWGYAANLPLGLPSSESFRIYHLKHHQYQGDYNLDADLASEWEAKLIGNSFLGKFLWELFFPLFQAFRAYRFSRRGNISFFTSGVLANVMVQFSFLILMAGLFGPATLIYFFASLFFSIGLHPLGARWIQEHYVFKENQETYSYYGPLNGVALNVGYHNEHHDFPFVAWNNLPKIRENLPEVYNNLHYHMSWFTLWIKFLTDKNISLYSRITRDGQINRMRPEMINELYAPETLEGEDGSGWRAKGPPRRRAIRRRRMSTAGGRARQAPLPSETLPSEI